MAFLPPFQSLESAPICNPGHKGRIQAARANKMVVAGEYEANLENFKTAYKTALRRYQKNKEAVVYYETNGLKNADTITTSVNKKFINGDINYLEWVMLMNQVISIQSDYIEALKNLNESAVEIKLLY